ncbi:acyloxyacyl hydrolase [Fulvivirgaceae bacterium BMA12]|uniref:Acyloxyacyl hydrolase n=1 Tax=Agaribacillus aureus TaxID=3051825 RepID=A0ABT8LGU6_9BACT|nr:acyloxyacyl hydrolase [Fulvivirgaceae bacterium BMA12]
MKMIKFITVLISLIAFQPAVWGQQDSVRKDNPRDPLYIGIKYQYGYIIAHSSEVKSISTSTPWGLNAEISQLKIKDKSWQNCNCYSKVGLAFSYTNFGNAPVLGNAYSLIFFFEPLLSYRKRLHFTLRSGIGIAYMNKIFDEIENPTNVFYSTSFSFPLLLNLGINYKVNPQWNINLSVFYNHISNGGIRQPNKGINYPTVALGLDYILFDRPLPVRNKIKDQTKFPWQYYAGVFGTTRSVSDTLNDEGNRKLTIGLNGGVFKRLGKIYAFNLGAEASYDTSHKEKRRLTGENYKTYIFSLMAGNNLLFGRYQFSQQFGFYLARPAPGNPPIFQRYALDYRLYKSLKIGISLKAHGHVAQNIDVRMGIVF